MRVFITGGSGWVGTVVIPELLAHGHTILALARSDSSAESIKSLSPNVEIIRGSLTDLDVLTKGASSCDGVIHCAFIHDFSNVANSIKTDVAAVQALSAAAKGPFIISSGSAVIAQIGKTAVETDTESTMLGLAGRAASDEIAREHSSGKGIVVRLPPSVHGKGDYGFVRFLANIAKEKGVSAYIGEGTNRWPSVHRIDAAAVYRLALEKGVGGVQYHAVAEAGVPTRQIAEAIGKGLGIPVVSKPPEEAAEHFGWIATFFAIDNPTSSEWTKSQLGWEPKMDTLVEDIVKNYF